MHRLSVNVVIGVDKVTFHRCQLCVSECSVVREYIHKSVAVSKIPVQGSICAVGILSLGCVSMSVESSRIESCGALLVKSVRFSVCVLKSI